VAAAATSFIASISISSTKPPQIGQLAGPPAPVVADQLARLGQTFEVQFFAALADLAVDELEVDQHRPVGVARAHGGGVGTARRRIGGRGDHRGRKLIEFAHHLKSIPACAAKGGDCRCVRDAHCCVQ
jgi:hypothetical protein